MAVIKSGWVLQPQNLIVMVLLPLTSQLFLAAIKLVVLSVKGYMHYASRQATIHVVAPASHFVNAPGTLGDVQHVEDFFGSLVAG